MSEQGKQKIVDAANKRFSHYSYGKTTMAEIATDCAMSVGNLYRFYKNKEDIAVAGTYACLQDKAEMAEAVASEAESAMQALTLYFIRRLRHLHCFVSETPHLHELVELISANHMYVIQHFEDRAKVVIEGMLQDGVDSGEFRPMKTKQRASDLYHATNRYNMPMCMCLPLEDLESELASLLGLLYEGLKADSA